MGFGSGFRSTLAYTLAVTAASTVAFTGGFLYGNSPSEYYNNRTEFRTQQADPDLYYARAGLTWGERNGVAADFGTPNAFLQVWQQFLRWLVVGAYLTQSCWRAGGLKGAFLLQRYLKCGPVRTDDVPRVKGTRQARVSVV